MKYLGGKIFLILSILLCSGFFIAQKCLAAEAGAVVINEIAWMGSASSSNDEWLELKNIGPAEIDLSGWTLNAADGQPKINLNGIIPAGGYFLLERTGDETVPGAAADQIYTGALGNSGEILELKDDAGNLIDKVDAAGGWPAGDNTTKQTMERKIDDSWQNSAAAGGTPKAANSGQDGGQPPAEQPPEVVPEQPSGTSSGNDNSAVYGDVLINEFASSPEAGENEWVELYNHGGEELSLDGWTIADGSGAQTVLSEGFNEDNYYFFVVEKPKGALNNDGDEIILYDDKYTLIDKIVYGKFGDQPENNAPAPGKGESAALKIDGQKSLRDKDSFVVTATPTRGKPNIILAPENSDGVTSDTALATAGGIAITEIFPNPAGSDRAGEFIEFYNSSDKETDLTGWRIEIEGGKIFEFGKFFNQSRVLKAGEYFALYRPESNLILDNNGGKIRLFAPGKSRAAQLLEYGPALEGASFSDTENIDLKNVSSSTKIFLRNSLMLNRWVWSAEPTPGRPNQIKTANYPPKISFSAPDKIITGAPIIFDASDSFDENGDALSFSWDFGDGTQLNLETPAHSFLKPGNYKIKLAVSDGQNSSLVEKILKVSGVDFSSQENVAANKIPIRQEFNLPEKKINRKKNSIVASAGNKIISLPTVAAAVVLPASKQAAEGTSINKLKPGAAWKISGTVIALPGTFGVQYFYIIPDTEQPAVKIYNYYKDFPALAIGDSIQASGIIGGAEADKYLKTKSKADIKILGQAEIPVPEKITAAGFKEENLGKFVQAEGEVESKSTTEIVLNDGTGKINLYLKAAAGIDSKKIKAGQKIMAIGLLSRVSGALAILPRGGADLIIATSSGSAEAGLVLGAATSSSAWTMPERKNNSQTLIYVLVAAGGIIVILAGLLIKKYLSK